jgi:hypothetical protein
VYSKLFTLAVCLLISGACAQDNQDYDRLRAVLNDSGIGCSPNVGSNTGSTELGSRPKLDISVLQKLIDDASDGSSIETEDDYVSSQPLHINKNITLVGSPTSIIDAQGTSQILRIDNPKANVTLGNFAFVHASGDYGGAIASLAKSLTLKDCRFSDSLANYGAAIYQKGGNLRIMDSSFEANNATIWGAAIYDNSGDMQVESSEFTQNPGSYVICFNGTQPRQAQVSIRNCNVSNNPGPYNDMCVGFGGAIVSINSTILIDHCTIEGNKALIITPTLIAGNNAGLAFADSDVMLNDTLIEKNEALYVAAIDVSRSSKVDINRCIIRENHAKNEDHGIKIGASVRDPGGEGAGISIDKSSEVTMNDVTFDGNIADGDIGAIVSAGKLNLNAGTVITRNSAKRYSALYSPESGIVHISKNADIYDNYDKQQPFQPVHSEGILNME